MVSARVKFRLFAITKMAITQQTFGLTYSPLVLLVEDNLIALRLVEAIVAQAGCRFISATDGEQALELAKSNNFDLIITDIGLPGLSGTELTSLIRDWEKKSQKTEVPIIGLTAQALNESESKYIQAGMNKIFNKPIYLHQIQALITQFILKNSALT